MSLGWMYCKKCRRYRKYPEYHSAELDGKCQLFCEHSAIHDADTEKHREFHTDDSYEAWAADRAKNFPNCKSIQGVWEDMPWENTISQDTSTTS